MYYSTVSSTAISGDSFFWNFYDNYIGYGERIRFDSSSLGGYFVYIQIYQNLGVGFTSAGSYIDVYLSPYVVF